MYYYNSVMASRRRPPFGGKVGFKQNDQGQAVLSTLLKQGRKSGQLNLSNRGFTEGMSNLFV